MKENLAFQKYASLCDLQVKNQVDLGPNFRNPKACKTFVSAIADTERNEIRTSCKEQGSFQSWQMGAQIPGSSSKSLFM